MVLNRKEHIYKAILLTVSEAVKAFILGASFGFEGDMTALFLPFVSSNII